ncbi:MAG: hypothetical protein IPI73_11035 [Betaproteobacteria bacterium]|nr:hypothetical protein [Betaproteobacteria bacterium]
MEKATLDELEALRAAGRTHGSARAADKVKEAGKLTARERLSVLLDPGTFNEIGVLARSQHPELRDRTPADGVVAGWGAIDGRIVYVSAEDVTVQAGTRGHIAGIKVTRIRELALQHKRPYIALMEAGAGRFQRTTAPFRRASANDSSSISTCRAGCRRSRPSWAPASGGHRSGRRNRTSFPLSGEPAFWECPDPRSSRSGSGRSSAPKNWQAPKRCRPFRARSISLRATTPTVCAPSANGSRTFLPIAMSCRPPLQVVPRLRTPKRAAGEFRKWCRRITAAATTWRSCSSCWSMKTRCSRTGRHSVPT